MDRQQETVARGAAHRTAQVGAAAGLLGSLAFVSTVVEAQDLSPRESFLLPVGIVGCVVASVGLAALVLAVPRLFRGLPGVAVGAATVAVACTLAVSWGQATLVVGIAGSVSDSDFDTIGASGPMIGFFAAKSVTGVVGLGALAVTTWRSPAWSRATSVLLGLAAAAYVLPPFPPGVLLLSTAVLLGVRDRTERRDLVSGVAPAGARA